MQVKSMQVIVDKYTRRAQAAQGDYTTAVQSTPAGKWETNAAAGAQNWADGLQAAIASGRFATGVNGKDGVWRTNTTSKGPTRYAQGVAGAGPAFQKGMQPVLDTLTALTLGPSGPRGDERNKQRALQVMDALHKMRLARTS